MHPAVTMTIACDIQRGSSYEIHPLHLGHGGSFCNFGARRMRRRRRRHDRNAPGWRRRRRSNAYPDRCSNELAERGTDAIAHAGSDAFANACADATADSHAASADADTASDGNAFADAGSKCDAEQDDIGRGSRTNQWKRHDVHRRSLSRK